MTEISTIILLLLLAWAVVVLLTSIFFKEHKQEHRDLEEPDDWPIRAPLSYSIQRRERARDDQDD